MHTCFVRVPARGRPLTHTNFSCRVSFMCSLCLRAADEAAVNAEAAGELHRSLEEFEKHAASDTAKYARD